jgi:hypothetical protein
MRSARLFFQGAELIGLEYFDKSQSVTNYCVRGKSAGAYRGAGSFQWTSAVKALCIMFLSSVEDPDGVHLSGSAGSLAASLDYAITKQPIWLTDMFGTDSDGVCTIRRFVFRTNSERKRPGPVSLRVNSSYLPVGSIEIVADGMVVQDRSEIVRLKKALLEGDFAGGLLAAAA